MNFTSCSATSTNMEDKFVKMKNELIVVKNQMQIMFTYIASRDDVPEYFATMTTGLEHPFINEVKFSSLFKKLN